MYAPTSVYTYCVKRGDTDLLTTRLTGGASILREYAPQERTQGTVMGRAAWASISPTIGVNEATTTTTAASR